MKLRFSENISGRWLGRVQLTFIVALLLLAGVGYGALRSNAAKALVQGIASNPLSISLNALIAIVAVTGAFVLLVSLSRAKEQEELINRFFRARGEELTHGGPQALADMPLHELPQSELSERLELIVAGFRNQSRIDPATLADVLAEREQGRVAVARYLASSLVLIGLLGTFVGLIVTVNGVTQVVSALDVGQNNDMPQFMAQLKEGIRQPLDGMGLAFSTSLVGLAASLVLGVGVLGLSAAQASWTGKLDEITALVSPTASSAAAARGPILSWPEGSNGPEILERLIDAGHFLHGLQKSSLEQLAQTRELVERSAAGSQALSQQIRALAEPMARMDRHYEELRDHGRQALTQRQSALSQLDNMVTSLDRSRQEQRDALAAQEQNLRHALSSFNAGVVQTLDARRSPPGSQPG